MFNVSLEDIKVFFDRINFLTGWVQAVGSLLIVWATYNIFSKQIKIKENETKLLSDLNELTGVAYIINNAHVRELLQKSVTYTDRCLGAFASLPDYERSLAYAKYFGIINLKTFDKKDFDVLFLAFGTKIINFQRSLTKLNLYTKYINDLILKIHVEEKANSDDSDTQISNLRLKISRSSKYIVDDIKIIHNVSNELWMHARLFSEIN